MIQHNYGLVIEGERLLVTRSPKASFFDPRYLVAALLEHVAQGDGHVCERELATMIGLVAEHFGLAEHLAERRFSQALGVYARSLELREVGALLQEILDAGERHQVLVMLLEVIAADGRQGADELSALDEVAAVLDATAEERHAAFETFFARPRARRGRRIHLRRKSAL
ncbi:TerB family tellurite resistance protein [Haliea sp. E17]|uniref:tellurite resistance TerB family protein n=1 Tax=Haliea sp. E17 TaxID=3401576 RepID=UPI003AB0098B